MCNLYRIEKNPDAIRRLFADVQMPLTFPEGIPNMEPRDVHITDRAPVVRFNSATGGAELVERRWSWPVPGGKPVFNMRSGGRNFPKGRCLVPMDGFYEYTAPADPVEFISSNFEVVPRPGETTNCIRLPRRPESAAVWDRLNVERWKVAIRTDSRSQKSRAGRSVSHRLGAVRGTGRPHRPALNFQESARPSRHLQLPLKAWHEPTPRHR